MITLLPARLKLLHFPRSHLAHVTHAIVKTCIFEDSRAPDYFFSFTENAYEVSIVASESAIDYDFLPFLTGTEDTGTSSDVYRVLQVDDEGGQDASGKRISDLSEPLAQSKFSIFYMSTYQTDFVLIKERRLRQAVQTLLEHGFQIDEDSLSLVDSLPFPTVSHTSSAASSTVHPNVSSESLASTDTASTQPEHVQPEEEQYDRVDIESSVLPNELRCAGLNPHCRSSWAMTVLKILSYPELIQRDAASHRFFSYTATNEGISLIADEAMLELFEEQALFQDEESVPLRVIQVSLAGSNLDRCGIVRSISQPLAAEAHINLLYLSTFKTANILVSADDIERAEEILTPDLEKMRDMLSQVVLEPLQ